ncbi:hypothetical protein HD597_010107 [Nonomuraea thailandensis]|uniref:Uncharacterized protein n=1 Tax=Nonomuraea thailandensis TaxID=1188745 RepID=A0A9X2GSJ3_9ACTN|nr:hypothetical protein [Nonomuraea thailandensis]MCP2363087.1 hypothetical protein [Nonomuraea thailandensis]
MNAYNGREPGRHGPVPPQSDPHEEPAPLDEIEASFDHERARIRELSGNCAYIADWLPTVFAELRRRRVSEEHLARVDRMEYTVTDGPGQAPGPDAELVTAAQAEAVMANAASRRSVWARPVYTPGWVRVSGEPPS